MPAPKLLPSDRWTAAGARCYHVAHTHQIERFSGVDFRLFLSLRLRLRLTSLRTTDQYVTRTVHWQLHEGLDWNEGTQTGRGELRTAREQA